MKKAVQQIMLGNVTKSEKETSESLKRIKAAGYDSLELNGFMTRPTPFMVRMLTKFAGMPAGKGGNYNWKALLDEAGLGVAAIHEDLGSLEERTAEVIEEAKHFHTNKVVITGMYRFDYQDESEVKRLCERLNKAGEELLKEDIRLLYHNHNIEFCKLRDAMGTISKEETVNAQVHDFISKTPYGLLIEETDSKYVNFELDSYWIADAGIDPLTVMKRLDRRMKLYHINDRGNRMSKLPMTPIVKQDSMELGYGNMNLIALAEQAKSVEVDGIILESHRNHIDGDPLKSIELSAEFMKMI